MMFFVNFSKCLLNNINKSISKLMNKIINIKKIIKLIRNNKNPLVNFLFFGLFRGLYKIDLITAFSS